MKINQDIIQNYENNLLIKKNKEKEILNIVLNDLENSDIHYSFSFPEDYYHNFELCLYNDENKSEENKILLFIFEIKEASYKFKFNNTFYSDSVDRNYVIKIENYFSFTNKIINNIELHDNNKTILNLFEEYYKIFEKYKNSLNDLEKNNKAFQDYQYSLDFDKILTLFPKDKEKSTKMFNYIKSAYYDDHEDSFIILKRNFDKITFRRIKVEGKNSSRLSLFYNGSRISKADLESELENNVILFNNQIPKSIEELIDNLNLHDLSFYRKSDKIRQFGMDYHIDTIYNHFKKHIVANNF
jgi:hypothetical protein